MTRGNFVANAYCKGYLWHKLGRSAPRWETYRGTYPAWAAGVDAAAEGLPDDMAAWNRRGGREHG